MAENKRNAVDQETREQTAQPSEGKKNPSVPKRITEWIELDDTAEGAVCDATTGQCTL